MRSEVIATDLRPLRLTFAQVCIWCFERWCESPGCIAKHDRSTWTVCDRCGGTLVDEETDGICGCAYGLVETTPIRVPAASGPVPPAQDEPEPGAPVHKRVQPHVPGAQGSLAHDPEYAAYVAYKAASVVLQDAHLVDENDEPLLFPGCVCCGRPMTIGTHRKCHARLRRATWSACQHCNGSRFTSDGDDCRACFGIGFIETDDFEGLVGSLYVGNEVVAVATR